MRLSEAALRCLVRRAGGALAAQPVVAFLLALVYLAVPPGLFLASRTLAPTLGPSLAEPAVARGLLVGLVLPAAAAGAAVGMLGSRLRPDVQIVAAPVGRTSLQAAVIGIPLVGLCTLAAPGAIAFALPICAAAPSGPAGTIVVLGAIVLGVLAGGAAVAAWGCVRRRHASLARGALALAAGSLAAGAAWPIDPAAGVLAGRASLGSAVAMLVLLSSALAISWLVLAPFVPVGQVRARARSARLGRSSSTAVARATIALLGRRADVRASLVGVLLAFIAGATIARIGGAPAPVGMLLGAAGAAVVLAPAGLAVGGLLEDGRWLWASVPAGRGVVVRTSVVGAGLVLGPWVAAAAGLGVLVEGASGPVVIAVVGAIAGSWGCALMAGMLVPWSRAGIGEQGVALAAFATIAAAGSLAVTRLGPELVELGVPASGIALTLPFLPVAVAIALGGRRLARGT